HCVTHAVDPHPFLFNAPATPGIYTLSLHDALPISWQAPSFDDVRCARPDSRRDLQSELLRRLEVESEIHLARGRVRYVRNRTARSEEHTSELQSRFDLVCRLLLEKKKKIYKHT